MGERDLDSLFPIYRYVTDLCRENNWPYRFNVDSGHHENAIQILENGAIIRPPLPGNSRATSRIIEPDLLDYYHKIAIEYDEEAKPNKGARRIKGHFEGNVHDTEREKWLTQIANPKFHLCIIWESDQDWKNTIKTFLENFHKEWIAQT